MNIQALMKQAQNLQKDMMKAKEEIDNMIFTGQSSLVSVQVKGTKEVVKININNCEDDLELVADMIVVALNNAFKEVDRVTEEKMGKYSNMMPGGMF